MKIFYLKLKTGEQGRILELIRQYTKLDAARAESLLLSGAVWNYYAKQRIKDPDYLVTGETLMIMQPSDPVLAYPFSPEEIIYEDPYMFILYKKPFFPTVPTPYSDICCLSYGLNAYLKKERPGAQAYIINRLDLAARGLVLVAKNKDMEKKLNLLFQERKIRKFYYAKTEHFTGVKHRYMIEDTLEWQGKTRQARSLVNLIRITEKFYYFLVIPKTGRTHQIRKHFKKYIHPIYGDPAYGNYDKYTLPGLLCFCYLFRHPVTNCKIKVHYVPDDFTAGESDLKKPEGRIPSGRII